MRFEVELIVYAKDDSEITYISHFNTYDEVSSYILNNPNNWDNHIYITDTVTGQMLMCAHLISMKI